MKLQAIAIMTFLTFMNVMAQETTKSTDMNTLELTQEWDKTFPQSDKVEHTKITFHNRYGITLAADLYKPKNAQGHLAAIAVSGPYGAVKEQVSGRYAQTLAERGFLTIAFDPSFYGESGGEPRKSARRISVRQSIICSHAMMWMRSVSGFSASAAGADLPSTPPPTTRVSRLPLPPPCTI